MKSVWYISILLGTCVPVVGLAEEQVEVLRDPWGVPHIFATTETDGFFGLGYATAEDRRLQMELVRRKGAGRLAEVFGPEWVQSDRESRIAGHSAWSREALAKLPADMRGWLSAYAAGVNAWTSAHGDAVARRFQPLGVEPEPWTPADCLLAARAVLSLGSPFSDQSVSQYHRFQELVAQGGEAAAEQQLHMAVEDAAAIVSETEMAKDAEAYQRLKNRPRMTGFLLQGTPTDGPKMSHAWAVGGARSKTGKPLLESDPQLPLSTPPFFYEFHLSAGPIDARGVGVPGCPGLFIGFNRHIAWGASALGASSHAVFLEQLTADGQGYLFAGQAEPFTRRLERIRVKGGADVVQEVLGTRHGVVFNSLSQTTRPGEAHVLYDPQTIECGTTVRAMLAFLTAGNWTEFRAAMEHYYDPGLHIVYADDQNNIGYQTLVHRPLTVRTPRMAQEGWTGQQEITGRIPLDELPHMLNPDQGFIGHANNMPVGTWYPFDLGLGTGGNGHTGRSWRLQQLLTGTHLYGVEDFEASVHRDAVNPLLSALLPIAIKVADEDQVEDAAVQRLIHAVRGWDLRAETRTDYPALAALSNVLTPYRGSGLNDVYGAGMGGVTNLARRLSADFAREGATPRGERERAYLKKWLQASAQGTPGRGRGAGAADDWTARMRQGAPEATGRTIAIPYQAMVPLQLPKIDPSLDIVSPPLTCLDSGTIWSQPGNLYTQIVDLADLDNSRAMLAPGNTEDAAHPLRTAGIELWVEGRTRPAPLSRDKVEQLGCSATRLDVQAYAGPLAPPVLTVDQPNPAAQLVAAIPAVAAAPETMPARPRPAEAQKPDDPQLESAFRVILRASGTSNEEVDAQLAETRNYVAGKPALIKQLRGAAVLGIYLIEESATGRLKVQYGSPYVLTRLRELLRELDDQQPPSAPAPAPEPERKSSSTTASDSGLLGHWPLRGDCQDHSGNELHGVNHGVKLDDGTFDGRGAYIEIPPSRKLQLGTQDFSFAAWVHTEKETDDVIGDVVSQYDAANRKGFHLTLKSTAGGYSSHGDDRHVYFGIDNAQEPTWEDCGRPSPTSNYVSNSLTVYDGHLYAAITDAEKFEDWCHVFRYAGGQQWEDCGRVGDRRTHGVGPMVVHDGGLYVGTWTYDWTRVGIQEPFDDFCCVYRYAGGTTWEDCGQPGQCRRLFGLASYRGKLYVSAEDGRCYVYAGDRQWQESGKFPNYAHPLGIHDGKLYAGVLNPAGVWSFDGQAWSLLGNPQGAEERCNQLHALEVYRGQLHATTWPEGHVCRLEANGSWTDLGRLGDALEINALSVYNGRLYGGTIPRAEVFCFNPTVESGQPVEAAAPEPKPRRRARRPAPPPESGSAAWTSVRRFLDPAGYEFKDSNEWARVTSLTVYQGKQFASLGSCTSSRLDAPCDFRGTVWSMEAGRCASYDRDLGPGWHHLTAVRRGDHLELFVDGKLAATSSTLDPAAYDLSSGSPLRIGFGEVDFFSGKIQDVRLYGQALSAGEVEQLAAQNVTDARTSDQAAAGPFEIVRSFPVSEATWAEKVGELYLVAAQRSVLVFRKTGPDVTDYEEVNRIVPGVDGRIENCAVTEDRLYVPAAAQGLLAYRLEDLATPGAQPVARYQGPRRIGAITAAGQRVYAAYSTGGIGVFDAETLELLGEGLLENGIGTMGLTASPAGFVYTTRTPNYETLLVVDAREPVRMQVVRQITNAEYPTMFRFPASVVDNRLFFAEHNGGVGVYDIGDPAAPQLVVRHAAIGAVPPRGGRNRPGLVRACAVTREGGFIAVDQAVRSLRFANDRLQDGDTIMVADLQGNGLLNPNGILERDGTAAVLTTMEGVRFYDVRDRDQPAELLRIDLPSRLEGLAKVGRMVYATADVDGVWQVDWEAEGGPRAARRIPLKGLSEDLALHRQHLYVANGVGLAVIDISDATIPREVGYWDFPYRDGKPDIQQGWVEGVDLDGDTLYAALGPAGMATFDVSDPARPAHLATIAPGTWGNEVVIEPRRKLLAYTGQEKFALVDVSDPRQPAVLSNTPVEAGKGTMGSAFSPDGNYLVVCQRGIFSVYDLRDARAPKFLRSYEGCGSENALFFREFLLVSGRGAGVGVWRVGPTPAELTHVQSLPCYFYNSKFWVKGDRVFTNSEGIDELRVLGEGPR